MQQALSILKEIFGYSAFRHQQQEIISTLLASQNALVLMPTGGGKSICYQIPSLLRKGTGVVISPLIALMEDQVQALQQLNINAQFLNSSLSLDEKREIEADLIKGDVDILYIAPERLSNEYTLSLLNRCEIALFAIDEAHCVSQWGHDFRPEYQALSVLAKKFPNIPRIALTATADERTRAEIIEQLSLNTVSEGNEEVKARHFVSSFDRPNIHYAISQDTNAKQRLWDFIKTNHSNDAGIIYCLSRKKVEAIATWLQQQGRVALPYHAGMSNHQRKENQRRFLQQDSIIIVATIAFGMGIDKPDVRFVAHLNLPKNIESYYQETGRAGRDGLPSNAWLNYGLNDVIMIRQMLQDSNGNEAYKRVSQNKLESLLSLCESVNCRRLRILNYFSEEATTRCDNCDNCLNPPKTYDASTAAQKALSTVYRTEQRFGAGYLIDILLGKLNDRMEQNNHHKLSTFGIGKELSANEWSALFRQLIAEGYLNVSDDMYSVLHLNEKSFTILRGETNIESRVLVKKSKSTTSTKSKNTLAFIDQILFDALKEKRKQLASEQSIPPFTVFHDSSLTQMALERPKSLDEFKNISGVGEAKLKHYGKDFIKIIKEHEKPKLLDNDLSDTINETLYWHSQDFTIEEISEKRGLAENTIYSHFSEAIRAGVVDYQDVIALDDVDVEEIIQTANQHDITIDDALRPLFEALNDQYSYGEIKCVLSAQS